VPRPVSIRVSYRNDASHLLRLEAALAKDKRQSSAWRARAVRSARKLALLLLEADSSVNIEERSGKPKKRRSGSRPGRLAAGESGVVQ